MMRRFFWPILLTTMLLLCGCKSRPAYMPDNDEMASLLYDIHLMESCARCGYLPDIKEKPYFYNEILEKHDMTPGRFDSCIIWLSYNRKEYKNIYNIVESRLEKEKRDVIEGKFRIKERFPMDNYYSTSKAIPGNLLYLFKFYRKSDGKLPLPEELDSSPIKLQQIPEVPYKVGASADGASAELSTDNSGRHPYVERL